MPQAYDVIVIGAGIAGVSTAMHLLMRGDKVLLLDRGAAGQETSYGNAGVIGTHYVLPFDAPSLVDIPKILLNRDPSVHFHYRDLLACTPWIIDYYLRSFPKWREADGWRLRPLTKSAIDEHRTLMRHTEAERHLSAAGNVKLHRSESSFAKSAFELAVAERMGVPFEVLDAAAFGAMEPHLKPAYSKAVRWVGGMRLTNPGAVVAAYADRFAREGGVFQQEEAQSLSQMPDGLWRLDLPSGTVAARHVVVCAGPWSGDYVKRLGYHFPLAMKRGYHRHFKAEGGATLAHALTDADNGYVICPMEQGYRLTTGAEFADLHAPPTPVQIDQILPYARQLFALGDTVDSAAWMGSRPCFTDSLPVIGAAPRHRGLWFNFGHGHMGLTIGPGSGRLLAEMIKGEPPFCDPHPYRAERLRF